ncbi:MAG TPA: hypothetical protein VGB55_03850 [Tepidisphaeraceae bacterium]
MTFAFMAVFLNVVVPGHTRGAIAVTNLQSAERMQAPANCGASQHDQSPTPQDQENCAVCFIAARYAAAPVSLTLPPKPALVSLLPLPPPEAAVTVALTLTYFACGPPDLAYAV